MTEHTDSWDEKVEQVAARMHACNRCAVKRRNRSGEYELPSRRSIHDVVDRFMGVLFPGCHGGDAGDMPDGNGCATPALLKRAVTDLVGQARMAFEYECELLDCDDCDQCEERASRAVTTLLETLPDIQDTLQTDIEAAYDGDPAACSKMEVVMSYPAIQAIATHRIAHVLYREKVPIIPRVMSELAHSRTGIDIHPGATIGTHFFIDHGTGVVIGETCSIGANVKIYQGVTLGALSFPKDSQGNPIKGIKRHPDVRDNVTIYAEATILGGETVIGENSEIGGNVWLTQSVPPNSKVYNSPPDLKIKEKSARGGRAGG